MKETESIPSMGVVEVFNFSQDSTPIRVQVINDDPWFNGNDVAKALGYSNTRDALNKHCKSKGVAFCDTLTEGGVQKLKYINEGNVYRLIINSNMPKAEAFEEWIFDEVLPSIRKKGYYGVKKVANDYLDLRDVPYARMSYNGGEIRVIEIDGEQWYSLNDLHSCIGSRTESNQSVKRLNSKQTLARKIWLYGVTQPGWFVNHLGVQLILSASQKYRDNSQLALNLANIGE